jgi:hypothetical protein
VSAAAGISSVSVSAAWVIHKLTVG